MMDHLEVLCGLLFRFGDECRALGLRDQPLFRLSSRDGQAIAEIIAGTADTDTQIEMRVVEKISGTFQTQIAGIEFCWPGKAV